MRYWLNIFIFLLFTSNVSSQIHFNRLVTEDGLSNNTVYDIFQDRVGFIWIATDDGLNRYDGNDFKVFRHEPGNDNSLSDNSVWSITEGKDGNIWIGTKDGWLNRYDPVSNTFKKWKIESATIKQNSINTLFEDQSKHIWIGTYRSGVYRLNPTTNVIDHWVANLTDKNAISYNFISSIEEDVNGNIWIGTYNGLNRVNPRSATKEFTKYFSEVNNPNSLSDNLVWYITRSQSDENLLWFGTANNLTNFKTDRNEFTRYNINNPENIQFGTSTGKVIEDNFGDDKILWIESYAGLLRYNLSTGKVERFLYEEYNPNSIPSNRVNRILKDKSGVLWIGTENGIAYLSPKRTKFNYLVSENIRFLNSKLLRHISITGITKTSDGTYWLGTDKGLFYTEKNSKNAILKKYNNLSDVSIWSLCAGDKNDLWVGTYGSGFYQVNSSTKKVTSWIEIDPRIKSVSRKFNKSIFYDSNNNLWIGFWGLGLARLNTSTRKFDYWLNEPNNPSSLSYDDVWVIFQDSKKRIWLGTNGGGLNLFRESEGGKFFRWHAEEGKPNTLSSNSIYSICESTNGKYTLSDNVTRLWVGTNYGLNEVIIENTEAIKDNESLKLKITSYTIKDGLADNSIKSIIEDDAGNLWLGTSVGITMFEPDKNKFTNYNGADGIVSSDINLSSSYKTDEGIIIMGGTSGLNYFFPKEIKHSSFVPDVVITDFQIFNKSVPIGENSPLKSNTTNTKEILLSYSQNVFSFQFAALDYSSPRSIIYAYTMEGFDDEWMNSGTRRFVTYTNLKPGKYKFKVKSTNSDGIWSDNYSAVTVIVSPPWWQTTWAFGLYVLIFVVGIVGILKFQSYRTRLINEIKIQEFKAQHIGELENMKSRFFANLSHEFRTPLTLIKGPLEQLISGKIKDNLINYYQMILRNTEKLQHLIDQLLELSQLETSTIPLNKQNVELVSLLRGFTYSFIPLAEKQFVTLSFNSTVEKINTLLDRDKLEKIINNLLSNAFKFTSAGGKVSVALLSDNQSNQNLATIKISDTGVGIAEEYQTKIFDRFFRVNDTGKGNSSGTGIGLALVKELATLHKWDISVESKEGEGTVFTLIIPLERCPDQKANILITDELKSVHTKEEEYNDNEEAILSNDKPKVLFVEDSPEVRQYVYDLFMPDYKLHLAENAEVGIELALKTMPDLIISDVMMPGMDGVEFCRRIKTDWQTSHIPVILLTAKATMTSKVEGLETGADDYVTKPFNFDELSVRIKNLIEQRKRLREKFSKEINLQSVSLAANTVDKEFLDRVLKLAEKNLCKSDFDIEQLATELFVSRRQLHRKLQAITGQTPGEFMRVLRLKKAAQMLIENRHNVTQIAYEVGFESPAQFTRAFKKQFDSLPSEFKNKLRN